MGNKNACIIVDLRSGEHLVHVPEIATVLAAAGWKTDVALKEYGGEALQLAQKAAKEKYDLVISYGGDGSLNALLNGTMYGQGKGVIADIPGGTFNVWAKAIQMPEDPVKAALALVDSEPRSLDLGHIEATGLTSTTDFKDIRQLVPNEKKPKESTKTRHYFLLNVGFGLDASMMAHMSKPLKYRVGPLAFDLSAAKELPRQHPFPIELQQTDDKGNIIAHWSGDVWEAYVSKVPLFAGAVNIEPGSRADDGLLYVTLITANGPLKTIGQAVSLLTRHKPDRNVTTYFHGTHFSLRIPASIEIQVDGSAVKSEDLLSKAEQQAFQQTNDPKQMLVDYHFDARPKALYMAVPRTYTGSLFEKTPPKGNTSPQEQLPLAEQQPANAPEQTLPQSEKQTPTRPKPTYSIQVIGSVAPQGKQPTIIVAGKFKNQDTDEVQVLAVRVDKQTQVLNKAGEPVSPAKLLALQEGQTIQAKGQKTKRGVIKATCVRLAD
ncbi:MAG TPA: diacylglycerol kinase family protein [Ktedonobacteraceae bacterium]|nr:diacylglycerol kinase family protein [Ktedonobacteraceae bacterium]